MRWGLGRVMALVRLFSGGAGAPPRPPRFIGTQGLVLHTPVRDGPGLLRLIGGGIAARAGFSGMRGGAGHAVWISLLVMRARFGLMLLAMAVGSASSRRGLRRAGVGAFVGVVGASQLSQVVR